MERVMPSFEYEPLILSPQPETSYEEEDKGEINGATSNIKVAKQVGDLMMHSQLLEGQKCEFQIENSRKSKESGHAPWLATLWRGKRACWSFGMGLGRIDKLHLFTRAYTKPTQGG